MIFNMTGGGKREYYSLLTVTTDEASLVGGTVTVMATGEGAESERYIKTFTSSLSIEFKLKQLTTYLIFCETPTEEAMQTITIPYYADYSAELTLKLMLYDGSWGQAGESGANVCSDITGGYTNFGTATYNSDNVKIGTGGARGSSITTTNKIDCTGYSKLKFEVTGTVTDCGITERMRDATYNYTYLEDYMTKCTQESDSIYSLDLMAHQGEYYVYIRNGRYDTATITNIWLE